MLLYIALNDWDNALNWCDILHERDPHSRFLGWRAAILAMKGDPATAKEYLAKYQKERPEIKTASDYEKVAPTIIKDILLEGLVKAGLPE